MITSLYPHKFDLFHALLVRFAQVFKLQLRKYLLKNHFTHLMSKKQEYTGLPPDTIIEVVAIKKDEIHIAEMTIEQFQNINKKP